MDSKKPVVTVIGEENFRNALKELSEEAAHNPELRNAEHYLFYRHNDSPNSQQSLLKIDLKDEPAQIWHYDTRGRAATALIKNIIQDFKGEFHDMYDRQAMLDATEGKRAFPLPKDPLEVLQNCHRAIPVQSVKDSVQAVQEPQAGFARSIFSVFSSRNHKEALSKPNQENVVEKSNTPKKTS